MADTVQRLDVSHEATFARPAFGLLREFPPTIKTFYETLGTRFSLNTAHTTVNATNTIGELSIRIGMFNNIAAVELRPDRMTISLPNVNNPEGVSIAKDTISLSHSALAKALPEVKIDASNFKLNIWIAMEGGAARAESFLSRLTLPTNLIDVSNWGASASRYSLRLLTRNDSEGWAITVFADPSIVPGSHLFLSLDFSLFRSGLRPITEQIALAETKLPQIFASLGLNVADGAKNNA